MNNLATSSVQSEKAPAILLVAANRWALSARLASGFLALGCKVAAVCPPTGHPIRKVRALDRLFPYDAWAPLQSVRTAIEQYKPDIIVPVCDQSVQHLHQIHAQARAGSYLHDLIVRSLGPSQSFATVSSRYELLKLARKAGIRTPETISLASAEDVKNLNCRLPIFLKADGTSNGTGVRKADSLAEAERAYQALTSGLSPFRLAHRLVLYRDRAWTIAAKRQKRQGIIAQLEVAGTPANCSVACWKGELIGGIAVQVLESDGPLEPAIIVQLIEGRPMLDAARQIVQRLQLTGFYGFDFIQESGTGDFYLIEMNPRCTPPCSLNLGEDRDLLGLFWSKLTGLQASPRPAATANNKIAYFPTAVLRNAVSPESSTDVYLDEPAGEPELREELLHPWSDLSVAGRLFYAIRSRLPKKKTFAKPVSKSKTSNAERLNPTPPPTAVSAICAQNDWRKNP